MLIRKDCDKVWVFVNEEFKQSSKLEKRQQVLFIQTVGSKLFTSSNKSCPPGAGRTPVT